MAPPYSVERGLWSAEAALEARGGTREDAAGVQPMGQLRYRHRSCVCLLGWLACVAACRVDGYYVFPDAAPQPEDFVTRLGGEGPEVGTAIAVAPNGDLVLTGTFKGTTLLGGDPLSSLGDPGIPAGDIWIARYRANGEHLWSMGIGGDSYDSSGGVAVNSAGDVYLAGYFTAPVNFGGGDRTSGGGFLLKLSGATGSYVWDRTFDVTGGYVSVHEITFIEPNTAIISGTFSGVVDFGGGPRMSTPGNCFLAAYDASTGGHLWSNPLTTTGGTPSTASYCKVIAAGGDVIAASGFAGTAMLGGGSFTAMGLSDIFLARFRGDNGAHVWSRRYGGAGKEVVTALAINETFVFVGGSFDGTTSLGGGSNLTASGDSDAFVSAYDISDGIPVWAQGFGSAETVSLDGEATPSIAATTDQVAVATRFVGTITLGGLTFDADPGGPNVAPGDVAIIRLASATGGFVHAWQLGSPGQDQLALTYEGRQLVGNGTFALATSLFGGSLSSMGGTDIAMFRVDLDRYP